MDSPKISKKNLMAPYQQSFRIDDLLTRKAVEQQPGHFCSPVPAPLHPPPPGVGMGGNQQQPEKPLGHGIINGKAFNGKLSETNSKYEDDSKGGTKRSSGSTSNEEEDDIYQKRKKARTAFSREQVADLEKKFQEKKYLSSAERGELAEKLKLSDMQVKTWFQNRRMKYKRQSEEAEMEMKSPKYPYSSFVSYGGVSPFYGYVPMPYKSHDATGGSVPYTYSSPALRSPQTTSPIASGGMDVNFVMNSPSMLGPIPSPLSAGMTPRHHGISTPLPRSNGTSSYFNGLLTPISPSTNYQHSYFSNEGVVGGSGSIGSHTQLQGFSDWPRVVPAPTTP